jgi:hypothetical protein
MSDNKEDKGLISKFVPWIILYTFLILALLIAKFSTFEFSDDISKWGSVGDYFGGLINPMLAFLSFIALLYTLKLNQEELAETRKELARAADAQEDSKRLMSEQLKTQFLQQFDSLFSTLLAELNRKIDSLYPQKMQSLERDIFECETHNLRKRDQLLHNYEMATLLRFLYQILNHIDENLPDSQLRKKYSDIVKSLLPDSILHVIMISFYHLPNEKDFNHSYIEILEKFEILEYMSFYGNRWHDDKYTIEKSMSLLQGAVAYPSKTFGKNKFYEDFNQSYLFKDFNKCYSFDGLLKKILENTKQYAFFEERDPPNFIHVLYESRERGFIGYRFKFTYNKHDAVIQKVLLNHKEIVNFRIEKNFLYLKAHSWYRLELSEISEGHIAIIDIVHTASIPLDLYDY